MESKIKVDLQTKIENTVNANENENNTTTQLEAHSNEWKTNFRGYVKVIRSKLPEYQKGSIAIRKLMEKLSDDGTLSKELVEEIQLYSSINKVLASKTIMRYDLRFRGQYICDVKYYNDEKIEAYFTKKNIQDIRGSPAQSCGLKFQEQEKISTFAI